MPTRSASSCPVHRHCDPTRCPDARAPETRRDRSAEPSDPGMPFAAASEPFADVQHGIGPLFSSRDSQPVAEGDYEYRLVANQSADVDGCEGDAENVEVTIRWGRNTLYVGHLKAGQEFYVGDKSAAAGCDFVLPTAELGSSRLPLVSQQDGRSCAVLRVGSHEATASVIRLADGQEISAAQASELYPPADALPGALAVPLSQGMRLTLRVADFTIEVEAVREGQKAVGAFSVASLFGGATRHILGAAAGMVGLLALVAAVSPPLNSTDDAEMTDEQRYMVQQYLDAAAETEREQRDAPAAPEDAGKQLGGTGTAASGAAGSMGTDRAVADPGRWAQKGPADNTDVQLSRTALLEEAATWGMSGLLQGAGGDINAPQVPWGGDNALGNDPLSAQGNMWGGQPGDATGAGGLALSGIGEGGGQDGHGIGLGFIGTYGHGSGNGIGQDFGNGRHGFGGSGGRMRAGHEVKTPTLRAPAPSVSGRLPADVIRRVIQINHGRFRACYESGLRSNPNLQGRVQVSFIIGRDGRVSSVGGGGDLPDSAVVSCISRSFYGLTFPAPESGIVKVRYPLMLTPG